MYLLFMRTFLSIEISKEIRDKIVELQNAFKRDSVKLVEYENMHITLFFFGNISDSELSNIKMALDNVSMKPFEIEISGLGYFSSSFLRVIFVNIISNDLGTLYKKVSDELGRMHVVFDVKEEFIPHLTIARVKKKDNELYKIIERNKEFYCGKMLVDKINLKSSILTSNGPIYNDLFIKLFQ